MHITLYPYVDASLWSFHVVAKNLVWLPDPLVAPLLRILGSKD